MQAGKNTQSLIYQEMAQNKTILNHESIILFTRFPEPGRVKTRLIEKLGARGAADLHRKMTEQVLQRIEPIRAVRKLHIQISYCGGSPSAMAAWLGTSGTLCRQQGTDLGRRMEHAFSHAFARGAQRVLLIGADCPGLSSKIITNGLEKLDTHSLVLGPAADGGYYLIGLCRPDSQPVPSILFDDIDWGSSKVLQQTVNQAGRAGISPAFLPKLHDIDRPEDLVHIDHHTCP